MDPHLEKKLRCLVASEKKTDLIDLLHVNEKYLSRIPLPRSDVDTAQAFRDAVREDIILNGVRFVGEYRTEAFVAAVKQIVAKFSKSKEECLKIADRIIRSCSRTCSGADSYFALEKLISNPNILLKTRHQDKFLPLDVQLRIDGKKPKCRVQSVNLFGLYRYEDIDKMVLLGENHKNIHVWIKVDTIVTEEIDCLTGTTTRYLSIQTPDNLPQLHEEIEDLLLF